MPARVLVLGSANTDLVLAVERVPRAGETVLSTSRADHPGGKGLNQAVAAARAGAPTSLLAALGRDEAGDRLAAVLADEDGLDDHLVRRVERPTGTALIAVQEDGDNAIIVDAGAGASLTDLTDADRAALAGAAVLVAQLEVSVGIVTAAARAARESGALVVLNAAPARAVPPELLALVDVLVVNEHEAEVVAAVTGAAPGTGGERAAASALLEVVPAVVLTLGAAGAVALARSRPPVEVPAPSVRVVDTTGAGDTAVGYLAAALAGGADLADAVRRAVVAGSASTTTAGAVPSVPRAEQVEDLLRALP